MSFYSCSFMEKETQPVVYEDLDVVSACEREMDQSFDAPATLRDEFIPYPELVVLVGGSATPGSERRGSLGGRSTRRGLEVGPAPAVSRSIWTAAGYGPSTPPVTPPPPPRAAAEAEMDPRVSPASPATPMGRNLAVWLEHRGLGRHKAALEALGARKIADLAHLASEDLDDLGFGARERAEVGVVVVG